MPEEKQPYRISWAVWESGSRSIVREVYADREAALVDLARMKEEAPTRFQSRVPGDRWLTTVGAYTIEPAEDPQ